MNPVFETIQERTSLRRYKDAPIRDEDLDALLSATLRAPTAGNMMLYSVLIVKDQETKKTLSKTCDNQPFIAKAPLVLVFLADYQRWFDYYRLSDVAELREPDVGDLFLAMDDAIIAAQTAVLAAESLGVGTCYIGDIMENYEIHRELLQLPDYVFPAAMLTLGYYPDDYVPKFRDRFAEEYIVHSEKYRHLSDEDLTAMFSGLEEGFSPHNKFGAKNMGQFTYARKTGSEFAREMSRSIRAVLQNWQGREL
ncbi:MAG: nitroreductase family protein [Limnochordia bacterium]|jgi:nitroreductase|nr:nitroreductase family protein [Limnochordia bacterium]